MPSGLPAPTASYSKAAAQGQHELVVSTPLQPTVSLVENCDGLAAQSNSPVQEGVLTGSQTQGVTDQATSSSSASVPVARAGPLQTASNNSSFPLRERVKEPEFV